MSEVFESTFENIYEFAYDGCHKMYLLDTPEARDEALEDDYDILPIEEIEGTFDGSDDLCFVNVWSTLEPVVPQFCDARFWLGENGYISITAWELEEYDEDEEYEEDELYGAEGMDD